jgi:integrase
MASLYRQGKVWWAKSYQNGNMVRVSLKTKDRAEAKRRMKALVNPVSGTKDAPSVTWDTAAADLLAHYRAYGSRDPVEAGYKLKRLTEHLHGQRIGSIDAQAIAGYVVKRKTQGMANGTINIELMTLGRALRLAREQGKLDRVPVIRALRPASPGTRFKSIRRRWTTACKKVGLLGMLVHDLRRTACRNLVHAGLPERVVMEIMEHRTRGMFDRYHIVSPQDLREASRKLSALTDKTTYNLGTGDD